MSSAATKRSVEIQNFASAINAVAPRSVTFTRNGARFASALTLKEKFFPRTDFRIFARNLQAAIRAGLVRAHSDADSCYIMIG